MAYIISYYVPLFTASGGVFDFDVLLLIYSFMNTWNLHAIVAM